MNLITDYKNLYFCVTNFWGVTQKFFPFRKRIHDKHILYNMTNKVSNIFKL